MKTPFVNFLVLMFLSLGTQAWAEKPKLLNSKARNAVKEFDRSFKILIKKHEAEIAVLKKQQAKAVAKDRDVLTAALQATIEADLQNKETESALATGKAIEHLKSAAAGGSKTKAKKTTKRKSPDIPVAAVRANGHHYLMVKQKASRNAAAEHAESLGGHLVRFDNDAERKFIHKTLKNGKYRGGPFWIDGSDEEVEGQWVGSNGRRLKYFKWIGGQPDNGEKNGRPEHGLELKMKNGKMNDAPSDTRRNYVIEWDQ